jgi:hypothetical protein
MGEIPSEYNFYNTSYRNDVSRWGGQTYKKPENISREIDLRQTASTSPGIARCLASMQANCRPVQTPNTLYRDSYVPHMPASRGIGPSYTRRAPPGSSIPDPPDPSILRHSTEYRSRYTIPRSEPFLPPELVDRCSTAKVTARTIGADRQFSPAWDTTYRRHYCEQVTHPQTTEAVTFHSTTGMR